MNTKNSITPLIGLLNGKINKVCVNSYKDVPQLTFVGGEFTGTDNQKLGYIALYNHTSNRISDMNGGLDGPVHDIWCDDLSQVLVVGDFHKPTNYDGLLDFKFAAEWSVIEGWHPWDFGFNEAPVGIARIGDRLTVFGNLKSANYTTTDQIQVASSFIQTDSNIDSTVFDCGASAENLWNVTASSAIDITFAYPITVSQIEIAAVGTLNSSFGLVLRDFNDALVPFHYLDMSVNLPIYCEESCILNGSVPTTVYIDTFTPYTGLFVTITSANLIDGISLFRISTQSHTIYPFSEWNSAINCTSMKIGQDEKLELIGNWKRLVDTGNNILNYLVTNGDSMLTFHLKGLKKGFYNVVLDIPRCVNGICRAVNSTSNLIIRYNFAGEIVDTQVKDLDDSVAFNGVLIDPAVSPFLKVFVAPLDQIALIIGRLNIDFQKATSLPGNLQFDLKSGELALAYKLVEGNSNAVAATQINNQLAIAYYDAAPNNASLIYYNGSMLRLQGEIGAMIELDSTTAIVGGQFNSSCLLIVSLYDSFRAIPFFKRPCVGKVNSIKREGDNLVLSGSFRYMTFSNFMTCNILSRRCIIPFTFTGDLYDQQRVSNSTTIVAGTFFSLSLLNEFRSRFSIILSNDGTEMDLQRSFIQILESSQTRSVTFNRKTNVFLLAGLFNTTDYSFGLVQYTKVSYMFRLPLDSGYVKFASQVDDDGYLVYGDFVPFQMNLQVKLGLYFSGSNSIAPYPLDGIVNAMVLFQTSTSNVTLFGGSFNLATCTNLCLYDNGNFKPSKSALKGRIDHIVPYGDEMALITGEFTVERTDLKNFGLYDWDSDKWMTFELPKDMNITKIKSDGLRLFIADDRFELYYFDGSSWFTNMYPETVHRIDDLEIVQNFIVISGVFDYINGTWSGILKLPLTLLNRNDTSSSFRVSMVKVARVTGVLVKTSITSVDIPGNPWETTIRSLGVENCMRLLNFDNLVSTQFRAKTQLEILLVVGLPILVTLILLLLMFVIYRQINRCRRRNRRILLPSNPEMMDEIEDFQSFRASASHFSLSKYIMPDGKELMRTLEKRGNVSSFLAYAKYDFRGDNIGELTFKRNDVIRVVDCSDEVWWLGQLNGEGGVFPASYVSRV